MARSLADRLAALTPAMRRALACGWVCALAALCFSGRLDGDFVWDDVPLVAQNSSLTEPGGLTRVLTRDLWASAGQASTQLYHPLPMLSLWLQAQVHGVHLVPLRVVNVLLHVGCALAFWALLRRRAIPPLAAALTTTLFVAHPLVTEPVLWVTGRHDTLAALATLLALLAFPKPGAPRAWARSAASGLCCAAAFASKEPYVVAPALVVAFSLLERPRALPLPRLARLWLPPFLGVVGVVLVRRALHIPTSSEQLGASPFEHLQNFASIALHYGALGLTLDQSATIATFAPASGVEVALFWLGCLATGALVWRFRSWQLGFGAWWFLLSLLPHVLSLPVIGLWGNRYGYFPLLGLSWMLATPLATLERRAPPPAIRAAPFVAGLLTLFCILQTRSAAALWENDLTLYGASVEANPQDGRALYHYAHAVRRRSGCGESVALFFRATQLDPSYPRAQRNLAGCLLDLGDPRRAVAPARRAVELEPLVASHRYNLGAALVGSGDRAGGIAELERALALDPNHRAARQLLAKLH